MLPYDSLISDKAGSPSSSAPSSNRNPRACENCRTRRIRCCGGQPCSACINVGLTERCEMRAKARPKRLPRIATEASSSGAMAGWRFDHFVASVQRDIERWAEHRGPIISAALPDVFPLRHILSAARLANRHSPTPTVVHSYLQECLDLLPYVDYVDRTTLVDLFSRYQGDPWALAPPQKALVFAASCLGSFKQSINAERDHAEWYKRSIVELDGWSQASTESLIALHFLHMYTVQAGGILETRDVLKRMAVQVRGLSIHHWPSDERDAKLLFATIYKDRLVKTD
ncbi:hypothetical protein BCR39DRAFT_104326 [Naematelia encephala]|uniref:Zn(2)-C6 fungal-type domain-containing protein n=1 Tax=Naematelia encephala TaxID=71784 RepID=A0A1Y2B885_9TREE|nr:hypothetical protein BCR39DRAFT_104326 [Naematelia encephala]